MLEARLAESAEASESLIEIGNQRALSVLKSQASGNMTEAQKVLAVQEACSWLTLQFFGKTFAEAVKVLPDLRKKTAAGKNKWTKLSERKDKDMRLLTSVPSKDHSRFVLMSYLLL